MDNSKVHEQANKRMCLRSSSSPKVTVVMKPLHEMQGLNTTQYHEFKTSKLLTNLPVDIHRVLFDNLNPVSSTCLGLTCKTFYAIHRKIHGNVPVSAKPSDFNATHGPPTQDIRLAFLLDQWMGAKLTWSPWEPKVFVTREEYEKRMEEAERKFEAMVKKDVVVQQCLSYIREQHSQWGRHLGV